MKKIALILLCALLMIPLLTSCSSKGEIEVSKKTKSIDLTDYSIVYGSETTIVGKQQLREVSDSLTALTATRVSYDADAKDSVVETADKEILVGMTNRVETQKALKKVKGEGWTIRVFDNKIVIVGTTPYLTRVALSYFNASYVNSNQIKDAAITLPQRILCSKMETVVLKTGEGEEKYAFVYSDAVDDDTAQNEQGPTSQGGAGVDYLYTLAGVLRSTMADVTGVAKEDYALRSDGESSDLEVFVGRVDRETYSAVVENVEADEYGIVTLNGKIVLLGYSESALSASRQEFEDMLRSSLVTDKKGNEYYAIPQGTSLTRSLSALAMDFPKPITGQLQEIIDVGNGSWEYIYEGDDVSKKSFDSYLELLGSNDYTVITEENNLQGSGFATLVNDDKGIMLHVYFAAYQYGEQQTLADAKAGLRIIATTTARNPVPAEEILSEQSYTKVTQSAITSLKMSVDGSSYVVTLEDGSFVVVDGGSGSKKGFVDAAKMLWETLSKLHTDIHGAAPSQAKPLRISAWLLTTEAEEHCGCFVDFINQYGTRDDLRIEYLLSNPMSDSEAYNVSNYQKLFSGDLEQLMEKGGFRFIKVHTGQIFHFANLKLEVLYTHEDAYPKKVEWVGNSATVFRATIGGESAKTALFLGAADCLAGRRLAGLWGEALKSDILQLSGCGTAGVERSAYDLISPQILLYPANGATYTQTVNPIFTAYNTWYAENYRYLIEELSSVRMIVFNDVHTVTMPLTGSTYQLYRTSNGEQIILKELQGTTYHAFILKAPTKVENTAGYDIIYRNDADDQRDHYSEYDRVPHATGGNKTDYVYDLAVQIQNLLSSGNAEAKERFPVLRVASATATGRQILVGLSDRADYMAAVRQLDADEYGVLIEDGKVMLLAWNDVTLKLAYEEFLSIYSTHGGIPTSYSVTKTLTNTWATDFPKPQGTNIDLTATVDVDNGCLLYVYTGEGTTRENFLAYAAQLEAAGYTMLGAENYNEIAGNSYRTYVNEDEDIVLYVFHSPYRYGDTLSLQDSVAGFRIVSAHLDDVSVPEEIYVPQQYTKVTDSKITAPKLSYEGMSYVITLEDGSFVILDGGVSSDTYPHAQQLYDLLAEMHTEIYGEAPSAQNPIRVSAWLITHEHADHYQAFTKMMQMLRDDAAKRACFRLEYFLYSRLSASELYSCSNHSRSVFSDVNVASYQAMVEGGFTHVKPHTGQVFYFANLKMEILYTHEDTYPKYLEWGNNASTVVRTTIIASDAQGTSHTTAVWFGDSEALVGRRVQGMWGDALKSDIVQLAHHGSIGVEASLYEYISPDVVFFPGGKGRYNQMMNLTQSNRHYDQYIGAYRYWSDFWNYEMNRYVLTELECIKLIAFNDTETVSLRLNGDGIEYALYDQNGVKVEFKPWPKEWEKDNYYAFISR